MIVLSATLILGCNSERRIYRRVGGNHLHLQSGKKELFWFNGMHGTDPRNPMFADITLEFKLFNPGFVLVEGVGKIPTDSISAIKSGESVYVAWLANQKNIPFESTEPGDTSIFEHLEKSYSKKEILAMYIIRQMVQWKRENIGDQFENDIEHFGNSVNLTLNYQSEQLSLSEISGILKPYTEIEKLSNANWQQFEAKNYLYFSRNRINEIYEATSEFRNIYLLQLIESRLETYQRIFIMMGFDHAKELTLELQDLLVADSQ